ncbi:hypothetical protein JCM10207_007067 [Rhodosporidiobolus poonsookiae]
MLNEQRLERRRGKRSRPSSIPHPSTLFHASSPASPFRLPFKVTYGSRAAGGATAEPRRWLARRSGANGISGLALVEALAKESEQEWSKIIAVSRSPPILDLSDSRISFVSMDLLGDPQELISKLKEAGAEETTHVAFFAYVPKPDEHEHIEVNRKLFANSIEAVAQACPKITTFLLQTGYKQYGAARGGEHLAKMPFKEDAPRHKAPNFYYVQEDMLKEAAEKYGWGTIVVRPNFILGASKGGGGSLSTAVALYAAARKALNEPLIFPGSEATYNLPYDFSTASNDAEFQVFLLKNEKAHGRAFNIHDGEPVPWSVMWPKIAEYFDVPIASPPAGPLPADKTAGRDFVLLHSVKDWAVQHAADFDKIVQQHGLDKAAYSQATMDFLEFATARTWADVASLDAAREIGWDKSIVSFEVGFKGVFEQLKKLKIIPA